MIESLPGKVEEFQVFLPNSTTEVITTDTQKKTGSVMTTL